MKIKFFVFACIFFQSWRNLRVKIPSLVTAIDCIMYKRW